MDEPEKQEDLFYFSIKPIYSVLRLKIRKILSPDFNFEVEPKFSTDDITQ
jgi:hypothetical protein